MPLILATASAAATTNTSSGLLALVVVLLQMNSGLKHGKNSAILKKVHTSDGLGMYLKPCTTVSNRDKGILNEPTITNLDVCLLMRLGSINSLRFKSYNGF